MKKIDEWETQKKKKKKKRKKESGDTGCSERVGAKWFCCTFKFGFL